MVLELALLIVVSLCARASDSAYSVKLVLVIELTNDCSFVRSFDIILCFDLWLNELSVRVSCEIDQAVLVAKAVVELTIGILEIFSCLNMAVKEFDHFSIVSHLLGLG